MKLVLCEINLYEFYWFINAFPVQTLIKSYWTQILTRESQDFGTACVNDSTKFIHF